MKTAILLGIAISLPAFAIQIPVAADAMSGPAGVDAKGGSLQVGGGYQSYLSFAVQPELAHVTSAGIATARLWLWVSKVNAPGSVEVHPADRSWDEATLTPANVPQPSGAPIATFAAAMPGRYIDVDVTGLVRSWRDAPNSEYGIVLSASGSTPGVSVQFDSKENTLTSHPAILDVSLSAPAGPPGPAGPTGDTGPGGQAGSQGPAGAGFTSVIWTTCLSQSVAAGNGAIYGCQCADSESMLSVGCVVLNDVTGAVRITGAAVVLGNAICTVENTGTTPKTLRMNALCGR